MHQVSEMPFILNFSCERTSSPDSSVFGNYCNQQDMWVDKKSGQPLIDVFTNEVSQLMTKTHAQVESDDQSYDLDLLTKTKVNSESDDQSLDLFALKSLVTKTDVSHESDDSSDIFASI
ncbi:hypothetical protein [Pseudoalteromonas sp. T1lg10]|uniref:hypothetical protein n=1 Tax=Pseudoalteromonas sp. T1lg10 TaxID=2077093 RepID=UPI000CF6467A|nr:hypothetical protein [Pseudoalteromonas sp. T1lg10]